MAELLRKTSSKRLYTIRVYPAFSSLVHKISAHSSKFLYFIHNKQKYNKTFFDLFLLTIFFIVLYLLFLDNFPLLAPDEPRYAEIAREMLELKNYLIPHLNYVLYFEKPPLFYWCAAFMLKIFGLHPWVARLPSVLTAILGINLTYIAGNKFFNRKTGICAALILASSTLYYILGRFANLDMMVSSFMACTLIFFIFAATTENNKKRFIFIITSSIFAALAVLTKGLIGIFLPGLVIFLWLIINKKFYLIRKLYLPYVVAIFLMITLPWHIYMQLHHHDFFNFYIIKHHFLRYSTDYAERPYPIYFYFGVIFAGFFPWCCFLPYIIYSKIFNLAARRKGINFKNKYAEYYTQNLTANNFFVIWILSILIFFSFSHSKLIPYILPIFPALALMVAKFFNTQKEKNIFLTISFLVPLIIVIFAAIITLIIFKNNFFLYLTPIIILIISLFAAANFYFRNKFTATFICLFLSALFLNFFLSLNLKNFDKRSIKPLAITIKKLNKTNMPIISYNHYFQDLPFYTGKRIYCVNVIDELKFGESHLPINNRWFLDKKRFKLFWMKKKNIFVVLRVRDLKVFLYNYTNAHVIEKFNDRVLIVKK